MNVQLSFDEAQREAEGYYPPVLRPWHLNGHGGTAADWTHRTDPYRNAVTMSSAMVSHGLQDHRDFMEQYPEECIAWHTRALLRLISSSTPPRATSGPCAGPA